MNETAEQKTNTIKLSIGPCEKKLSSRGNRPLVDKDKILLPPLHTKLGLMKNFVKAVNKQGKGFEHLREKFPKLGDAKLKEGIFIEPQVREIINDLFVHMLTENEKSAWLTFTADCLNFLGNVKTSIHDFLTCISA